MVFLSNGILYSCSVECSRSKCADLEKYHDITVSGKSQDDHSENSVFTYVCAYFDAFMHRHIPVHTERERERD